MRDRVQNRYFTIGIMFLFFGVIITPDFSFSTTLMVNEDDSEDSSLPLDKFFSYSEEEEENENIIYCPVCGHPNGINTRRCVYCGALLLSEDNEGNLYRYCIYCGHKNPPDATICEKCNYRFNNPRTLASLSELIWRKSYSITQDEMLSQKKAMYLSPIAIGGGIALFTAINPRVMEPATGMLKFIGMSSFTIGLMRFITANIEYQYNKKNIEELRKSGIKSGYIKY
ncbi:MAG: hypothetical protein DRH44_01215 [Candidatus Coatesbacteria bacterium]|nr:MAG: hypothetical protein DRH44_01215 [Candidatus Coatesbacteria bacterium]